MGGQAKGLLAQLFRFNLVGAVNTALTYLIYSLLVLVGCDYRLALVAEYAVGVSFSFVANKAFTFRNRERIDAAMTARMVGSYALLLALNLGLLTLLVQRLSLDRYLAQTVALTVVVSLSFAAQKLFVFRAHESGDRKESTR